MTATTPTGIALWDLPAAAPRCEGVPAAPVRRCWRATGLLGLEVDAEPERQRAIAAGLPADAEPYLRLRDDRAVPTDEPPGLADPARRRPTNPS